MDLNKIGQIPVFFKEMLEEQYGKQMTEKVLQGYQTKRNTTFRVNTLKSGADEIKTILEKKKVEYETVVWSKEAFILKNVEEKEIRKETPQAGKTSVDSRNK